MAVWITLGGLERTSKINSVCYLYIKVALTGLIVCGFCYPGFRFASPWAGIGRSFGALIQSFEIFQAAIWQYIRSKEKQYHVPEGRSVIEGQIKMIKSRLRRTSLGTTFSANISSEGATFLRLWKHTTTQMDVKMIPIPEQLLKWTCLFQCFNGIEIASFSPFKENNYCSQKLDGIIKPVA